MQPQLENISQDHFPAPIEPLRASISQNDTKTIYNKLTNFQNLDSTEKSLTVSNLPIMLDQLGESGMLLLKPLLNQIMQQVEFIKNGLLYKIPQILAYLEKRQNFDANLKTLIIPIIIKFLNAYEIEIKQEAGKQLGVIASKLNKKDRGEFVLKHVLLMSHDDANENNRLIAVQLLSNLSECLGPQLCEQFIGLEFLSLVDDTSQKVKKQAIKNLPIISKMVSQHFFEYRILPFYYEKANDFKNWGIRKVCADIIIQITQFAPENERQTNLTNIMLNFTEDNSRWVKLSAYKNLGKFLFYLKGLEVHQKLFKRFLKMTQGQIIELGNENEIPYSCAFNFPAVVNVMGPERWPQMYKTYQKLLKMTDKRIKISLSQSLYEVAKIIGEDNTQKYLFPVIDKFIKEESQDVKLGIVKNMSQIIFVLSDQKRESMVEIFEQFQKDQRKWRIRQSIAQQLPNLLELYPIQTIFSYMMPILLRLCSDPVSTVRQQAANCVPYFIQALKKVQNMQSGFIESIKAFASSTSYIQRVQFITICKKILRKNKKQFLREFIDLLINLKNDIVINVRLSIAQLIYEEHEQINANKQQINLNDNDTLEINKRIEEVYKQLVDDQNEEIREIFKKNQ